MSHNEIIDKKRDQEVEYGFIFWILMNEMGYNFTRTMSYKTALK
jgi:hypothetical protein